MSQAARRTVLRRTFPLRLYEKRYEPIEVAAGERIRGIVELLDGESFDAFLVDSEGLADWLNDDEFEFFDGVEEVRAVSLDARSDEADTWYLAAYTGAWMGPSVVTVRARLDAFR